MNLKFDRKCYAYFYMGTLFLLAWLWYLSVRHQSITTTLITGFLFMAILPKMLWKCIWILRESNLNRIFPGNQFIETLSTNESLTVRLLWSCSISGLVPALISKTGNLQSWLIWLQSPLKVAKSFIERNNNQNLYLDQGVLLVPMDSFPRIGLLTIQGVPDYYRVRGKTSCYSAVEPGDCQVQLFELAQGGREIRQRLLILWLASALLLTALNTVFTHLTHAKYREWREALQEYAWAESSQTWPKAVGEVYSTELRQISPGKNQWAYEAVIRYNYKVAEVLYHGDRLHFGYRPSPLARIEQKKLEHYPTGDIVKIAYDPRMPERSILETGSVEKTRELASQTQRAYWFFLVLLSLVLMVSMSVSIALSSMIYQRLSTILSKLSSIEFIPVKAKFAELNSHEDH